MELHTPRLILLASSPEQLLSLIEQPDRFADLTGYAAAEGLREFYVSGDVSPAWLAELRTDTRVDPWRHGFFLIERDQRSVIGSAGFKGHPDAGGTVEIAYGIVRQFERKGYATEAASALVDFASADPSVVRIRAHTLPTPNASTRVLAKCGFRFIDRVIDPEDGLVWRWERAPAAAG